MLSNTTALAEIGCLHQRLWRYNLAIIFLFRFINFCFLVYVIDSHSSWRVWQRPTTITRGYTYSRRFDQRLDSISKFGNLLNYPSIFCQFLTMFSPCLFFCPVRAYSIWCIVDRKYTSFLSRYRSIITLPLLLKALSPRLRLSLRKLQGSMTRSFRAVPHAAVPLLSKCWKSLRLVYQLSMYTW